MYSLNTAILYFHDYICHIFKFCTSWIIILMNFFGLCASLYDCIWNPKSVNKDIALHSAIMRFLTNKRCIVTSSAAWYSLYVFMDSVDQAKKS